MELVRGWHLPCGASWAGEDRMHCSLCCQTWDAEDLYLAHRADGYCRRGEDMGLVQTRNGIFLRALAQSRA